MKYSFYPSAMQLKPPQRVCFANMPLLAPKDVPAGAKATYNSSAKHQLPIPRLRSTRHKLRTVASLSKGTQQPASDNTGNELSGQ